MSIKVDIVNLARFILVRLSIASACTALLSLFIYVSGNVRSFSGEALLLALKAGTLSGLLAMVFSVSGFLATVLAPLAGNRFSVVSVPLLILSALLGLIVVTTASSILVVAGGLSF